MRPADSDAEPRGSSVASFLFVPSSPSSRLRMRPGFSRGSGYLAQGLRVGMKRAAAPLSDLGSFPPRNVGGGSSSRCPRLRILGGGAWQPPGECPRRAFKTAPPIHRGSSPPIPTFMERGRQGPWDLAVERAPAQRRAGARPALMPFLAQRPWALPSAAAEARERQAAGSSASAAASSPPRPVPQNCSWHWRVGKPEGGARRETRRQGSELGAGL